MDELINYVCKLINSVYELINSDRSLTIREIHEDLGISIGSCHSILTSDLWIRRVVAKFVPRLFTTEQKENRLKISSELIQKASYDDDFIKSIITGDETCVYGDELETKVQSSQ